MTIPNLIRILINHYGKKSLRENYWEINKSIELTLTFFFHRDLTLRNLFRENLNQFFFQKLQPVNNQIERRILAAANWILYAQSTRPDAGVALGYFPEKEGYAEVWQASYPETTGYIITTMFKFAEKFSDVSARQAAISMSNWEIAIQMKSGAVQGGALVQSEQQTPVAFNTGMVLDGWCSAYEKTGQYSYLEAGRHAANFLINDLDEQYYFKTNGAFVSIGEIKTYNCLCAWALYRFGQLVIESIYCDKAIKIIEAAILQQQANGWFAHNCLNDSTAPLTHTIGYTLQGILEIADLTKRNDFISSVRLGLDPILDNIASNGFLPGRFYSDWKPATLSSCLTGSAQIAIVTYRFYQLTGEPNYKNQADKLLDFLKALQDIETHKIEINGAIAGSFPFLGDYMPASYPNWATKYFLDALLLQECIQKN